jgi:osmotically inducible lipoprotein OsmB
LRGRTKLENADVNLKKLTLGAIALASLTVATAPQSALARHYYHHRTYYRHTCHRRSNTTIGTVGGAVGGALIGSGLTHGSAVGTLGGAAAGAYAGHAIGKHNC